MKRVVLILAIVAAFSSAGAVACHPMPESLKSRLWSASAEGLEVGVIRARTVDSPWNARSRNDHGGEYAVATFSMNTPVRFVAKPIVVRPHVKRDLSKTRILPASAPVRIVATTEDEVALEIERPCKFSLEPDGWNHPLVVLARGPMKDPPDMKSPATKIVGPGIVEPKGGIVELKDGETLYLRPGTVLKAGILARGRNVRVCGRGIIDGSDFPHGRDPTPSVVWLLGCRGARVDGVTIVGGWQWNVVPWGCEDVTIEDVAVCGSRVWNDDGINVVNSRRVAIRDCFVRTDDDCFCMKGCDIRHGDCTDVTVENCVFWSDRARIVLLGWVESLADNMSRLVFRNNEVVRFRGPVFTCSPLLECRMENILFENVRIHNDRAKVDEPVIRVWPKADPSKRRPGFGSVDGVKFRNIDFYGTPAALAAKTMDDPAHPPANVTFENVTAFGKPLAIQGEKK